MFWLKRNRTFYHSTARHARASKKNLFCRIGSCAIGRVYCLFALVAKPNITGVGGYMQQQNLIIQLAPISPLITREKFAEAVGMSKDWVDDRVNDGSLPVVKVGRSKLINVALYWKQALEQPY